MKEDVLDVLMYIFERYQDEETIQLHNADYLIEELENVGFSDKEINNALNWLDGLVDATSEDFAPSPSAQQAIRVYSEQEMSVLNIACRGFLQFLEQIGVLDEHTREMVIDRVMALGEEAVDLERLKWVVMMVLFNMPGKESAFAWVETLDLDSYMH